MGTHSGDNSRTGTGRRADTVGVLLDKLAPVDSRRATEQTTIYQFFKKVVILNIVMNS